jgi:hypothetical protein
MFKRFKKQEAPEEGPSSSADGAVKAVYVMTFTTQKMPAATLQPVVKIADNMLRKKTPAFVRLWEERVKPETMIEVSNLQYAGPMMHTPQSMQATLAGWIKKQYDVEFKPEMGENFFPHGMRDPQGKENFFLFYFDMED